MTYLDTYFDVVEDVFARIRSTQRDAMVRAADLIAERLAHQGALAVMDTGHMLRHEAFTRAGGMVTIAPFSYALHVECPLEQRTDTRTPDQTADIESRMAALALDNSKLKRGDVLIINSNSGRTSNVIEVALQCTLRGITTIAICSSEQMKNCPAAHPSGKKLSDVADICIDNCGPHGDAAVPVRDNEKMCPMSGLAAAYIFWAIHAETVQRLQARGINPTIFRSVHVGGPGSLEKQRKEFLERGI